MMNKLNRKEGFTLIEILVVIGIIAVLAAVVLVAINPARQFAQARNSQRSQNVSAILDAIGQNIADNRGTFVCGAALPDEASLPAVRKISKTVVDLRPCLVSTYMSEIPEDPQTTVDNTCTDDACSAPGTYDTEYEVFRDSISGRITISAPLASADTVSETISVTR